MITYYKKRFTNILYKQDNGILYRYCSTVYWADKDGFMKDGPKRWKRCLYQNICETLIKVPEEVAVLELLDND